MKSLYILRSALVGGASAITLVSPASAKQFDIPRGNLAAALSAYTQQAGVQIVYSDDEVRGRQTQGARGNYTELAALTEILRGTGFTVQSLPASAIAIVPQPALVRVAQAAHRAPTAPMAMAPAAVETVVVTAQKKSENIQNVPIAVTALSQQQLTERQIAGGPDLVKEVPNLTFSKTNFSGYNLEIRGIGTQAISVTTDPAVAVAFNDIPFIRNHFFEQEFYDLQDAEVLRGPQGTLYGRNATAGVVNLKSALPTDSYEAMMSADIGNYSNRRLEAMLNIPIVGDTLDLRIAGEWTKRDGYTEDTTLNTSVDGRDLWSGRMTLGWKPTSDIQAYLVWEHFSEDDDRLRSGKQLCKTDTPPTSIGGVAVPPGNLSYNGAVTLGANYLSQGCEDTSLYSPSAFEVPYGFSLPYAVALGSRGEINENIDPYASTTQSTNLRQIESAILPHYLAKNDTLELNVNYAVTPSLTLTSQTGYNHDFLWSTEDYNRFNTSPGIFINNGTGDLSDFSPDPAAGTNGIPSNALVFCDPQLGCSDRLVAEDLSEEHAWQFSQEFRLASNFSGPFNFSFGGNYLHYETEENYYVFINALTIYSLDGRSPVPGVGTNQTSCISGGGSGLGYQAPNPIVGGGAPLACVYIDPNPIGNLNNKGHNYFLSQNPYTLNSYAGFGEAYYNLTDELKLTGGLRWTDDQKHFIDIPSELVTTGYGYEVTDIVNQQWNVLTGRTAVDWTPKFDFTDQTLIYGSYNRGYKAGGANPPGAVLLTGGTADTTEPIHPLTFKPEFIDAFELGSKNTMLDGALTLNGDVFYYDYKDYQISEILDRTSVNLNFNASVEGAELESTWEPLPGLKFSFSGGYENTRIDDGQSAVDLMDRTAGTPGWMVVKPFVTQASNCILPTYVVVALLEEYQSQEANACAVAYNQHLDPATLYPYDSPQAVPGGPGNSNYTGGIPSIETGPTINFTIPNGYPGFNPLTAPNNGAGFAKNLGGNQLPNAPHFTTSLTADYTMPVSDDWAATFHTDFYWQSQQWARVFEDPIDKIHGYSNVNLALILTSANGWEVMGYVKNVFDVTAITGTFLNSDDSGLTTNVFLTDPRLFGVRVTKHLDQNDGFWGSDYNGADFFTGLFSDTDNGKPQLWVELGGQAEHVSGQGAPFVPQFLANYPTSSVLWNGTSPIKAQEPPLFDYGEEAAIKFEPSGSDWVVTASIRYGRASNVKDVQHQTNGVHQGTKYGAPNGRIFATENFAETQVDAREAHTIMDFTAGKDVGLGLFGSELSSVLNFGVRVAQFKSTEAFDLRARPDLGAKYYYPLPNAKLPLLHFHTYHDTGHASRSFHGVGPTLSWTGSAPLTGDLQENGLTFDWGANAALLFGRQNTRVQHHETANYHSPLAHYERNDAYTLVYQHPSGGHPTAGHNSNRNVAVPNLGGFAGVSYRYQNAKISLGYRTDFFFGAIDGGIDKRHSETLNMGGPFATISFGLGG